MTGKTAIEGTFLPQQVQCLAYCMHGITYGDSTALNQLLGFYKASVHQSFQLHEYKKMFTYF